MTAIGKRARKMGPFVMRSVEDANRVHMYTLNIYVLSVYVENWL